MIDVIGPSSTELTQPTDGKSVVKDFVTKYRLVSTNKGYTRHQTKFKEWCETNKLDWLVPSEEVVCRYLIFKHESPTDKRWSASTFGQARSAISDMYRFENGETASNSIGDGPLMRATMATIKKVADAPIQRKPFTQEDHFIPIFRTIDTTSFTDVRDYYMMLLAFGMVKRSEDITKLKMKNVTADDKRKCLIINHTPSKKKEKKNIEAVVSYAEDNPCMDVGRWHKIYISLVTKKEGEYYLQTNKGEKLSAATPRQSYKRLFAKAGLDWKGYGGHSARVGGATAIIENGGTEQQVKDQGDWTSEVWRRYNQPRSVIKAKATTHLNKKPKP